jgi:hypothetical protein
MSTIEGPYFVQQLQNEEANVVLAEAAVKRLQQLYERRKKRVEALRNLVDVLTANPVDDEAVDSTELETALILDEPTTFGTTT